MSFELELNRLYEQIAQQINEMIPVEWEEFYFNGEVKEKEGGVFFFFSPVNGEGEPIYSHDIPDQYQIDEKLYTDELHKLFLLTVDLQQIFIDNNQEPWFSTTILVQSTGKINVHFDYTDWHESEFGPTVRIEYFEYKYLNKNKEELDLQLIEKMKKFELKNLAAN